MAEILNLRQARKARARQVADAAAEANRISFGRSKAEVRETTARQALTARRLDNHKRDASDGDA
ncbi:DUF4169 family protein [Lichenihabitans sp. Uapishka_5]|uniref:DUF4169 family protein n=1 Tax=Lichenihabitans sp. Uapishka_5 TaxID=3037302 RepID=UPI0029E821CE|nr:DUF4169 family protein [Lichenihabitans sp. Uapishka_5]MDX7952572.1 DUF4169 family protein [Lichenihabitans sp. Uapishka_5]